MRTAEDLRGDFLLDPDIVHLNHGAFGASPRPVLEHQHELREAVERDPVEFLGRSLPASLAVACGELAEYVGVADPERLVLVANSTTALNAVAASIPLTAADEIVITDREYGAMRLLWEEVAAGPGARLVVASLPLPAADAEQLLEAVWSAVTPRTRVLFFSHVTSETALVLPAEELCRRAREEGSSASWTELTRPARSHSRSTTSARTVMQATGTSGFARPRARRFSTRETRCAASCVRPSSPGAGTTATRSVSAGAVRTIRQPFSLCPPPSTTRQRTTGLPYETAVVELARRTQRDILERLGGEPVAPEDAPGPADGRVRGALRRRRLSPARAA